MTTDIRAAAEQLFSDRRRRDTAFAADRDGFGEPAWDILLGLMAHQEAVSIDHALQLAGPVPADTARTYLRWLASRDLVELGDHVVPTPRAFAAMRGFLDDPRK